MPNSTLITDYVGRGLLSARPTTPNIPAGGTAFYYATDVPIMYQWSGTAWVPLAPAAGKTYHDVTSSRVAGTTYTNGLDREIYVTMSFSLSAAFSIAYLTVGGLNVSMIQASSAAGDRGGLYGHVPPGASYIINLTAGSLNSFACYEYY